MALKIEEIEKQMRGNVDSCCHPEYWNIRNYAPDIAAQYIKARRFEVTDDFIKKALEHTALIIHPEQIDTLCLAAHISLDEARQICEEVLESMWEEIEQ